MKVPSFTVPEGFTVEDYHQGLGVVIELPIVGGATINWKCRYWCAGYGVSSFGRSTKKYVGRGWAQAIVDDAVAMLREVGNRNPRPKGATK